MGTLPLQYEQCVWYTQGEVLLLKHVLSTAVHSLGSSSNFHDNLQKNAILYSFVLRRVSCVVYYIKTWFYRKLK